MNHLKKLKEITGKEFMYDTRHTVITDYEIDEEGLHLKATVSGNPTELLVPIADAHQFFSQLLPIDKSVAVADSQFADQQRSLAEMRRQLMSFNQKLMSDDAPKYIKQAKALNNNVNTIINSLKLEFQVAKEIKRNQNK